MNALERVLRAAIKAPGNRSRFEAAGLIAHSPDRPDSKIDLVEDWQAAFSQLRPITKETIRQSPGQFLASVEDVVYRGSTSGTSGRHFIYFANGEWNRARIKTRQLSLNQWGIDEHTPILNVSSRLLPVRLGDRTIAGVLTLELIDRLRKEIAVNPTVIRGYPSRLCEIAAVLTGQGFLSEQRRSAVLGVICTGEPLFDFQKALLERVFAAPVINEYGCQESGISGMTCPEMGRLHLDCDRCLYEIIDGQLVSTDLFNTVMPMVRYQCGDVVELHSDPCPCGRSTPTATVRGRVEDTVRTMQGLRYLGDVEMPELPGILQYRVVRGQASQTAIQVYPHPGRSPLNLQPLNSQPLNLQPLVDWAQNQFGKGEVEISVSKGTIPISPLRPPCATQTWIDRVTQGSWSIAFSQLPEGEGRPVAQLLYELVSPTVIQMEGIPQSTRTLLQQVSQTAIADDSLNELTARILLFACCFFWNDSRSQFLYRDALQRLHPHIKTQPTHPANLDRLITTLFLDTSTARLIWREWLNELNGIQSSEVIVYQVDTFTIQYCLQALESAVQRAYQTPHSIGCKLRPLLSVLIGDLSFFASRLMPWLLGSWFELIHGETLPRSRWLNPPESHRFDRAWVRWRQQLIQNPGQASLTELRALARSPEEQERVVLEDGYRQLVQGQSLCPEQWIGVLQQLGESGDSASEEIDIVSWQPILKGLVQPLFEQGQPDLAYDCLRAATVPSSRISAFERLAIQQNHKQYVLQDLFPQTDA